MSVRKGTAIRAAGKATAERIVEAARVVLTEAGQAGFSLRAVAENAGLHLANVQYYFPRRSDLIRALLRLVGDEYRQAYDRLLDQAPADPRERFKVILDYNLEEIVRTETRHFFVQLWALLESADDHQGVLLGELYAIDVAQLSEAIAEMHPDVPLELIQRRATLLASLIEGLMVVRGSMATGEPALHCLVDDAKRLGLAIADGLPNPS